jgi:hypothetical protein
MAAAVPVIPARRPSRLHRAITLCRLSANLQAPTQPAMSWCGALPCAASRRAGQGAIVRPPFACRRVQATCPVPWSAMAMPRAGTGTGLATAAIELAQRQRAWNPEPMGKRLMHPVLRFTIVLIISMPAIGLAHPGGLAADGCYDDRKNGGRHCHGGAARSVAPAAQPQRLSGDVYFANCAAARAAGAAPVRIGSPGYGRHLDRDGDGVGCE